MPLFFGTSGSNTLVGGVADDALFGFGGNDTLTGGNGNDALIGGSGNDQLFGGNGNDGFDGGTGSDGMYGGNGNDVMDGAEGNDFAQGGAGNDLIDGGDGNDILDGDSGNDSIVGGNGNDDLLGDDGNDTLRGASGSDTLDGGAGTDILDGNGGNVGLAIVVGDTFDFDSTAEMGLGVTRDVIVQFDDFGTAQDVIDLRTIDANTTVGGDQAFSASFIAATSPFTAAGQIRIIQNPVDLTQRIVQLNTDNDAAVEAEFLVQSGGASLDSSDFLL